MGNLSWLTARPVAHRGLHDRQAGRIENSLSAVDAAICRNFAIEVDLQIAGDGVPMVFHDPTLDRLTGETGPVREHTSAHLSRIRLAGSSDTIPTFEALLQAVDGRVPLVVELKPHGEATDRLVAAVLARMAGYGGRVALMSFDPRMVRSVARQDPAQIRGIVADATPTREDWGGYTALQRLSLRHLLHFPRTRPHFIAYDCKALPAPGPFLLKAVLHRPVLTWTVRGEAEKNRVERWSDQIIFEGFDPEKNGNGCDHEVESISVS